MSTDLRSSAVVWAAFASLGAGLVHAAVVREHFAASMIAGGFLFLVALIQIGWALATMVRGRLLLPRTTATGLTALIALWAASRTVGLPFDSTGVAEPVGRADLLCVLLELLLLVAIGLVGREATAANSHPRRTLVALALGASLVAALTAPALAATDAGTYARPHHGATPHSH